MDTTSISITKQELQELIEKTVDQKLSYWLRLVETRLSANFATENKSAAENSLSLEPLPVLQGHIPQGWKEAIYRD
jgi:hypothetical protein